MVPFRQASGAWDMQATSGLVYASIPSILSSVQRTGGERAVPSRDEACGTGTMRAEEAAGSAQNHPIVVGFCYQMQRGGRDTIATIKDRSGLSK